VTRAAEKPRGSTAQCKSGINDWADVDFQTGNIRIRRPDWINVEIVAVILGCAIGCAGLAIRSIEGGHLEGAAGYRDALTVGNDVRNFQRPLISESGADKKTWIFGYRSGHLNLGRCFCGCWCIGCAGSVLGLARGGDRRKADYDVPCVPAEMIRTSSWRPGAVDADLGFVNDDP
jgi:hypothetical protein